MLWKDVVEAEVVDIIERSDLFDADFYLRSYPDVAAAGVDPLVHYVRHGAEERRNPHPHFNAEFYCQNCPDLGETNPLVHFIFSGAADGRPTVPDPSVPPLQPNISTLRDEYNEEFGNYVRRHKVVVAKVEVTSTCNLRCLYCAVSQPDYVGVEMSDGDVGRIIDEFKRVGAQVLCANGHGETTSVKGWEAYCRLMFGSGNQVEITSNLSLEYDFNQIDVLSRIEQISISIDTLDREVLARVRRKVDVRTILTNMVRIRAAALRRGERGPKFIWLIVLCDQTIHGLVDLVAAGLALGVEAFSCGNMTKYPDLPGLNVYPLPSLPLQQRQRAVEAIEAARALALDGGARFSVQAGLMDVLMQLGEDGDGRTEMGRQFVEPDLSETRLCLDPWEFVQVKANGDVQPCCWHSPIGNIKGASLEEILTSRTVIRLRGNLLRGTLDAECKSCPTRARVPVQHLRDAVEDCLDRNVSRRMLGD